VHLFYGPVISAILCFNKFFVSVSTPAFDMLALCFYYFIIIWPVGARCHADNRLSLSVGCWWWEWLLSSKKKNESTTSSLEAPESTPCPTL